MKRYGYSESEFNLLQNNCMPFAIYQIMDKEVIAIVVSQGFCDLFDYETFEDAYDVLNTYMYRDVYPDDIADLEDSGYQFINEGGDYDVIYRSLIKGEYRIIHAYGKNIYKEDGTHLAAIWYTDQGPYLEDGAEDKTGFLEIMRKGLSERSFNRKMAHDSLTGLPAMTYFFELAEEGSNRIRHEGKIPSILFMDFNGMKNYNRKYGLEEGDKFLVAFKDFLCQFFDHSCISRFSADHFCAYTDSESALKISKKIITESKEVNKGKSMPLRIGIYDYTDESIPISAACDRAKIACDSNRRVYDSKIYPFDKAMIDQIEKRQYVVENVDKAIENGWIRVSFQPVIRTANGKVCSEEALSRWEDPEKGLISPSDYVPVLEDAGSIYKLDLYVVENVLKKMKHQVESGLFLVPQSINLSRSDFYACDIVEEIRKRVDDSGIPRDRIIIEITESAIADDLEYMAGEINSFKDLGFTVWMDDYGSGYSSPIILQKIPFDLLKIDMLFVKQIQEEEKAKIILTEIVKMALALGMDTVAEGVETIEQANFLKEIGCTMLQGYYYCRPIFLEEILERYRQGKQIGFENPEETAYYSELGKVSLYSLSITSSDEDSLKNYFDTWPMVMVECIGDRISLIKCNKTFREFKERSFPTTAWTANFNASDFKDVPGSYSLNALLQCARDGKRVVLDDRTAEGKDIQLLIRRVAVNPITGAAAVMAVVLSVTEAPTNNTGLSYNYIARALSEDYIFLYFINMDTGEFTEYSPDGINRDVSVERRGKDFFTESLEVASSYIYKDDLDEFLKAFNKERIQKSLDENGTYTLTYRNMIDGVPTYVSMKIVKIRGKGNNVILGINNVDAQMRHKEALEKIREERLTYSRITALTGDFIAMYNVDAETDEFFQSNSSTDFDSVEVNRAGANFYTSAIQDADNVIYEEDLASFKKQFSKEKIFKSIEETGMFSMNYRLMIDGIPNHVQLRAVKVHEDGRDKILMGVMNKNEEVRREQEYASALFAMRAEVDLDELTGVKSKRAYIDLENEINAEIDKKIAPEFAIAVFDINGLKEINDTYGHQAGDQYIIDGCQMICKTFKRSPVFRLGGDEFAVVAQGTDYNKLDELMQKFEKRNRKNKKEGLVVVAAGASRFDKDKRVSAVFKRADQNMYENKKQLKE